MTQKKRVSPSKIPVLVWPNKTLLTILVPLPNQEPLNLLKPSREEISTWSVNLVSVFTPLSLPVKRFKLSPKTTTTKPNGFGSLALPTLSPSPLTPEVTHSEEVPRSRFSSNKTPKNSSKNPRSRNWSRNIPNLLTSPSISKLGEKWPEKLVMKEKKKKMKANKTKTKLK